MPRAKRGTKRDITNIDGILGGRPRKRKSERDVDNPYAAARTAESQMRAKRLKQIYDKEARDLVEVAETERIISNMALAVRARLRGIPKQMKAMHRGLSPKVYQSLEKMIDDTMTMMSKDAVRLGEADDD